MMAHKKLQRFSEIKSFPNVLEYPQGVPGKWHSFFKNRNPIVLELACGKGEYTTGLAVYNPDRNFIGVDIKGNRIWVGAKYALKKELKNVAFLRTQIEKIDAYFDTDEVDEIWITFPDPQPRISKAKKRLTHPRFLRLYKKFLIPQGTINLKTDSEDLFNFTKMVTRFYGFPVHQEIGDLYNSSETNRELFIKTHYESLDISGSRKVFFLSFSLHESFPDADIMFDTYLKQQTEIL
jgi:tRNA (guanine-N7-)-methyltransferase